MLHGTHGETVIGLLRKNWSRESGFTLIELLITILIIAILVAIAVPVLMNKQGKADRVTAEYNLRIGGTCVDKLWFDAMNHDPTPDSLDSYRDHFPPEIFTESDSFKSDGYVPFDAQYMSYYETKIRWAALEVGGVSPPIASVGFLPSVLADTSYGFQISGIYRNGIPLQEGSEIATDWGLLPGKICVVQSHYFWEGSWLENTNNFYITLITLQRSGTAHYLTKRQGSLVSSGTFSWDNGAGVPGEESADDDSTSDETTQPEDPPSEPTDDPQLDPGDDTPAEPDEPAVDPPADPGDNPPAEPDEPAVDPPAEPDDPPLLASDLRIEPETINIGANGVITIFITVSFSNGYTVDDIDVSSLKCCEATPTRCNINGNGTLIVKFDREDLLGVPLGDEVLFTVTGNFTDGTPWQGFDIVRVID